jgi:DNA-binding transcriptional LysR family regulator
MNVHHLELFHHVCRHGGISAAVRKMPYGIQQPAVSGQLLQLEKTLGLKLFQRRPFALTPAGRDLLAFVAPFFGSLGETSERLRQIQNTKLRLAAPATILRRYLPELLRKHQTKIPGLTLQLRDANHALAEELLQKQEIDLAITELDSKPSNSLRSAVLFKLPLALVVPQRLKINSVTEWLRRAAVTQSLISLPPDEVIAKQFQRGLRRLRVNWAASIEVSSLDLIPVYVSLGFGVGVSIITPGTKREPGTKLVPLRGFPPLVVAALWQKHLSAATASFLAQIKTRAAEMERQLLK